jgi:hypothetical protein
MRKKGLKGEEGWLGLGFCMGLLSVSNQGSHLGER